VRPSIVPFGDEALLVTLDTVASESVTRRAHALASMVRQAGEPWGTPVPGYATVLVPFDPTQVAPTDAAARLTELIDADAARARAAPVEWRGPTVTIGVRYGGEDGPDLAEVAHRTGLSPARVIELHGSVTYLVQLMGFAPGFAYLGPLPEALALPRRGEPRVRVPAGSVAIAGRQTAVYPFATPGGWHLIGRTEAPMWNAEADSPATLAPGMRVRFVPEPT
jgi:KipI family sensor histidine kinase inhibitor